VKLGLENKRKTMIAAALALVAIFLLIRAFSGGGEEAPAATQTAATVPAATATKNKKKPARTLLTHSLDPTLRFDLLKSSEDVTYKGNGRNIFSSTPAPVMAANGDIPQTVAPVDTAAPPPPPPPPSGLKFYGFAGPKGGSKKIFLLKGEDIFLAKEGDIVDRRYKITHVGATSVEVQDVLTNHTETIPLDAG
jgi:hypothetical protein